MKPLFLVFVNPAGGWLVCGVNLEGEPVLVDAKYRSLKQALAQAARANELYAGIKPVSKRRK